jgi:hypothetical protein
MRYSSSVVARRSLKLPTFALRVRVLGAATA